MFDWFKKRKAQKKQKTIKVVESSPYKGKTSGIDNSGRFPMEPFTMNDTTQVIHTTRSSSRGFTDHHDYSSDCNTYSNSSDSSSSSSSSCSND